MPSEKMFIRPRNRETCARGSATLDFEPSASVMLAANSPTAANRHKPVTRPRLPVLVAILAPVMPPFMALMASSPLAASYTPRHQTVHSTSNPVRHRHSMRSIPHGQTKWPNFSPILPLCRKAARTCSKNATDGKPIGRRPRLVSSATPSSSIDPRHHACRAAHIGTIVLSECTHHHRFFATHATEKQNAKADQSGRTRDPIRQEQQLRKRHQPECRIHRMPNACVDAGCDERVALPQIEADRPVFAEIVMGAIEQP